MISRILIASACKEFEGQLLLLVRLKKGGKETHIHHQIFHNDSIIYEYVLLLVIIRTITL